MRRSGENTKVSSINSVNRVPSLSSAPSRGFIAAGLANILGILICSMGFSNALLTSLSPMVFSIFGLLSVILWGLAYLTVARTYSQVPYLVVVFAVEKLVYVITWILWLTQSGQTLPGLFSQSPITAIFFALYGLNDLVFGLFFAAVATKTLRRS